jgi:hypothetical protein
MTTSEIINSELKIDEKYTNLFNHVCGTWVDLKGAKANCMSASAPIWKDVCEAFCARAKALGCTYDECVTAFYYGIGKELMLDKKNDWYGEFANAACRVILQGKQA